MPTPNLIDIVRTNREDLVNRNVPQDSNLFPFLMTALTVWDAASLGHVVKLIGKTPAQNGYNFGTKRYAIDAMAFINPDGTNEVIDCIIDAGPPSNTNVPAWAVKEPTSAPLHDPISRDALLAAWPLPGPTPDPDPVPPPVDLEPILRRLEAIESVLKGLDDRIHTLENKPLPDYVGEVSYPFFGRRRIVSKPVQ